MAGHLLKWVHFLQDTEGRDVDLRYFRDTDGREVDFVVVDGRQPLVAVECKYSAAPVSTALRYLKHKFPGIDAWQVHATGTDDYQTAGGVRVTPFATLAERMV